MPGVREIRAVSYFVLGAVLVLIGISVVYGFLGRPVLGHEPGGDFLQFYVAGKILNEHPHELIYDVPLENRLQHRVRPTLGADSMLVYANAPFAALPFRILARLPYIWAYIAWLGIVVALYIAGLRLVWPHGAGLDAHWKTALLVSLSFVPFAVECCFSGQLSTLGFFALALSIWCQRKERPFVGGMALALCAYKPTLLVLALPMLLVGRRFRVLAGFAVGFAIATLASFAAVGRAGLMAYARTLALYSHFTNGANSPLQTWKYVDIASFLRLLFGAGSQWAFAIALILAAAPVAALALAWARSKNRTGPAADLLWAATISWTLVFNTYVPVYDTSLAVLAMLLTVGALYRSALPKAKPGPERGSDIHAFQALAIALYVGAWFTQIAALAIHVQIFTLLLACAGWLQLRWSKRAGVSA